MYFGLNTKNGMQSYVLHFWGISSEDLLAKLQVNGLGLLSDDVLQCLGLYRFK